MSKKIRVAVLYGGRSGEHEVSLMSAASVIRNLDSSRFDTVPVAIDKDGRWYLHDTKLIAGAGKSLPVFKDTPQVVLPPYPVDMAKSPELVAVDSKSSKGSVPTGFDVVFPVMHGTNAEDGTIQGLFELADVAYVGCGVLSSAVGMDKDVAKRLARDAGIPIVPFVTLRPSDWSRDEAGIRERVQRELGFPVFVKPANSGSSVGVHKVKEAKDFAAAVKDAFRYDSKVLVEKAVQAREIEFSVLESLDPKDPPRVSIAGEIAPTHEFYSYEAKYMDENGARLMIPAQLSDEQMRSAQNLARDIFVALECEGMARVDLFLDKQSGAFYLNEINTLPGFTQISMYPKLWEATGISYKELLSQLVDLALARHTRRKKLLREYSPS